MLVQDKIKMNAKKLTLRDNLEIRGNDSGMSGHNSELNKTKLHIETCCIR